MGDSSFLIVIGAVCFAIFSTICIYFAFKKPTQRKTFLIAAFICFIGFFATSIIYEQEIYEKIEGRTAFKIVAVCLLVISIGIISTTPIKLFVKDETEITIHSGIPAGILIAMYMICTVMLFADIDLE